MLKLNFHPGEISTLSVHKHNLSKLKEQMKINENNLYLVKAWDRENADKEGNWDVGSLCKP